MAAWRTRRCGPSAARKSVGRARGVGGGVGAEYSGVERSSEPEMHFISYLHSDLIRSHGELHDRVDDVAVVRREGLGRLFP